MHALGLGEVSVRSGLGQPLHAVVDLIDVPSALDSDCFRLSPASVAAPAPADARLTLVRVDGRTALHIRTPGSLYDPVVQFVLGTDCDVRMQREYALLLDPPVVAPAAGAPLTAAAPVSTALRAPVPETTRAKVRADKPAAQVKQAAPATDATPRLVLSGKRHFAARPESRFALQLDTTLPDPARIGQPGETLTPTELSDENTALTRKLAHLETQLSELRQRNVELEARAATTVRPPVSPAPPPAAPRWPLALLLLGLLAGIAAGVIWLRRRARTPAVLPLTMHSATQPVDASLAMPDIERMDDDPHVSDATPPRMAERSPAAAREEGTEVKEDILDQAEVFMAHGHGDFAIHLLQEHLRAAPTESPVPWLLLLDLQHRAGDAEGYAATSAACRRYFNINLSGHPISQDGNDPGPGLEAYPHLLNKLVAVWHTPDVDGFLNELIYDDRGGTRMGFEPGAYRDILLLRDISMQSQYPRPGPVSAAA